VERALSQPPGALGAQGEVRAEPSRGPYAVLKWNAPAPQTLTYHVYRSRTADCPVSEGNLADTTTNGTWADLQLEPETEYYYRVVASNGLGQAGEPGEVVKVRTGPVSKARGCRYTKSVAPHPGYSDVGDKASTDGVYAGPYADRKSYAYWLREMGDKVQVAVTVDLGTVQRIARATHHNCGAAGYGADMMRVSVSTDGQTFAAAGATEVTVENLIVLDFPEVAARYVRFEFSKERRGSSDDWLFIDELEVF
jgi:hypothetical protein